MKLGILNYKIGNLASIQNAFLKIGQPALIIEEADKIKECSHLILPGVGAFGEAMEHLKTNGMQEAILDFVQSGNNLLGICLGMQLLFERSYEFGEHKGLGLLKGEVVRFEENNLQKGEKIPHIGWNNVKNKQNSSLLKDLPLDFYLYFVHSYCVRDTHNAVGISYYGGDFASIVQKDNIYGIQPHPEKSHNLGLKILANFLQL
ncbi:MAG: imidazole glycerol phosphate synthase subunit HisH [Helicobacter sp.]|nr:imidazole glycerol phosphate synthase subunit HisH [Helicobacter sp.]